MGSIVVCGGSVIGLSAAMMLAVDGHQVTVPESNPQGAPTSALEAWESRFIIGWHDFTVFPAAN